MSGLCSARVPGSARGHLEGDQPPGTEAAPEQEERQGLTPLTVRQARAERGLAERRAPCAGRRAPGGKEAGRPHPSERGGKFGASRLEGNSPGGGRARRVDSKAPALRLSAQAPALPLSGRPRSSESWSRRSSSGPPPPAALGRSLCGDARTPASLPLPLFPQGCVASTPNGL